MNSILDDISAVIGFSATTRLAVWWGDTNLYVPTAAVPDHPMVSLIGEPAYRALVKEFGGKTLAIPHGSNSADKMQRRIAEMTCQGDSYERIADLLMLSPRRVQQIRDMLREKGLLLLVQKRRRDISGRFRWGKSPLENPPEKAVQEMPGGAQSDDQGQGQPHGADEAFAALASAWHMPGRQS